MRACFLNSENLVVDAEILIVDKQAHHLINVVRIQVAEEILILNGKGISATGKILTITKKNITLKICEIKKHERFHQIDLAIAVNKKDAMEDILKMATELGVRKIYPLRTQYSQPLNLNAERVERLFASAIEQSNNAYKPELMPESILSSHSFSEYKKIYCLHFEGTKISDLKPNRSLESELILIGPEAGFGGKDIELIKTLKNIQMISLNLPILRATTAVPVAIGLCLGRNS